MTLHVEKPYVKPFNRPYSSLSQRHPEYDLSDPDMMIHYDKHLIATYSAKHTPCDCRDAFALPTHPLDAHLHTSGGAIPSLGHDIFPEDDGRGSTGRPV
jgi:hypothetical protein